MKMDYNSCFKHQESILITAAQMRAARALLGLDQRALARVSQLSLPTIQRMEASEGVIRGTVDSLMKLVAAIEAAGVDLINDGETSNQGGRGVRLSEPTVVKRPSAAARLRTLRGAVMLRARRR